MSELALFDFSDAALIKASSVTSIQANTTHRLGIYRSEDPYVQLAFTLVDGSVLSVSTEESSRPPRILVVADNEANREFLVDLAVHPNLLPNQNRILEIADALTWKVWFEDTKLLKEGKGAFKISFDDPELAKINNMGFFDSAKILENNLRVEAGHGTAYASITITEIDPFSDVIEDFFTLTLDYAFVGDDGKRIRVIEPWQNNLPKIFESYEEEFRQNLKEMFEPLYKSMEATRKAGEIAQTLRHRMAMALPGYGIVPDPATILAFPAPSGMFQLT